MPGAGTSQRRMRLPVEIVRRTRESVGPDFIIIYRLSMLDLVENGSEWSEVVTLAKAIEAAGATPHQHRYRLARGAHPHDRHPGAAGCVHLGHRAASSAKSGCP